MRSFCLGVTVERRRRRRKHTALVLTRKDGFFFRVGNDRNLDILESYLLKVQNYYLLLLPPIDEIRLDLNPDLLRPPFFFQSQIIYPGRKGGGLSRYGNVRRRIADRRGFESLERSGCLGFSGSYDSMAGDG